MDAHPCKKKPGAWTRAAAALALTLGTLTLSAGPVAAEPAAEPVPAPIVAGPVAGPAAPHLPASAAGFPHTPDEALAAFCAEWEAFASSLPFAVAPPPVCKLVNGWD
ncbi:hypothetical protein [Streptomyces sp. NPDC058579]|uniref:hypothetical protein n=1 Tax=Streptomyces sp. NPDC058579 TaxID=3346548 RepID=UPI003663E2CB